VLNRSWLDVSVLIALAIMVGGVGILAHRSWGRTLSLMAWIAALVGEAIDQLIFFSLVYPQSRASKRRRRRRARVIASTQRSSRC